MSRERGERVEFHKEIYFHPSCFVCLSDTVVMQCIYDISDHIKRKELLTSFALHVQKYHSLDSRSFRYCPKHLL